MSETNKATVRRFLNEAFEKGNLATVDELVADTFVDHNPPPTIAADKAGLKATVNLFRTGFPDCQVVVEDLIAEGDKVAMRVKTRGTHTGQFLEFAPTGRRFEINEQHIIRFAGGKIVEHWGVEDNLSMMQQLGVIPGV